MTTVLVLVPQGADVSVPAGTRFASFADADAAAAALAAHEGPAVILSDSLDAAGAESVAKAVRSGGHPVIEVRSERWDGTTWSPLSAACRGVIAGFGTRAVTAAVTIL